MAAEGEGELQQQLQREGGLHNVPLSNFLQEDEILNLPQEIRLKIHEWNSEVGMNFNNLLSTKGMKYMIVLLILIVCDKRLGSIMNVILFYRC